MELFARVDPASMRYAKFEQIGSVATELGLLGCADGDLLGHG
jgi:hypothetical protein